LQREQGLAVTLGQGGVAQFQAQQEGIEVHRPDGQRPLQQLPDPGRQLVPHQPGQAEESDQAVHQRNRQNRPDPGFAQDLQYRLHDGAMGE
jgi:hypothetical protein